MSGAHFEIRVDDREVQAALARLAAAAGDLRPAMKNIGESLVQSTKARFRSGVGPDGQPWAPLKPATLKRKARMGKPSAVLVLRGFLSRTIRYQVDADGVQVGTDRPYGAIHQFGGEIQIPARSQKANVSILTKDGEKLRKGMWRFRKATDAGKRGVESRRLTIGAHTIRIPARPYLGVSAADRTEIVAEISDHIMRAAGGGDAG